MAYFFRAFPIRYSCLNRCTSFIAQVLIAVSIANLCVAAEYESRIWTDKSGQHEIKAKFIDLIDGQVRLERPNGDISRIPLEKLSEADQNYVKNGAQSAQPQEPAGAGSPGFTDWRPSRGRTF